MLEKNAILLQWWALLEITPRVVSFFTGVVNCSHTQGPLPLRKGLKVIASLLHILDVGLVN